MRQSTEVREALQTLEQEASKIQEKRNNETQKTADDLETAMRAITRKYTAEHVVLNNKRNADLLRAKDQEKSVIQASFIVEDDSISTALLSGIQELKAVADRTLKVIADDYQRDMTALNAKKKAVENPVVKKETK
jgi:hypothetical protein